MSVFADAVREQVLTPKGLEDVQRAAQLLREAAPVVKEALDLLVPIEWAMNGISYAIYEDGGDVTDEASDAVRGGTYQEAVDLAFGILDAAKEISERSTG